MYYSVFLSAAVPDCYQHVAMAMEQKGPQSNSPSADSHLPPGHLLQTHAVRDNPTLLWDGSVGSPLC